MAYIIIIQGQVTVANFFENRLKIDDFHLLLHFMILAATLAKRLAF